MADQITAIIFVINFGCLLHLLGSSIVTQQHSSNHSSVQAFHIPAARLSLRDAVTKGGYS